jgi:acetyl-CoA/propionyl-CoA carboxylase, biotin carboxylase, biotin carboxyl carrier protein
MFASVLVANRGEIAVRVIATLRRLGIRAIAVYSDADAGAPHVRLADEAVALGPAPAEQSYLSIERILHAVAESGAEAVHPGYGFLSERADFARACPVTWIGPPPEALELLGDKVAAKRLAAQAGVPVVPGLQRPDLADDEIVAWAGADPARLPLMVKAASGGGGRGMRVVTTLDELPAALRAARREAQAAFGDGALLAERYVEPARHVEIQFLADAHGAAVHLGERECSLQRRHQKLLEECPSPAVSETLRARMGDAALGLAQAAGYVGAGTCEFLLAAGDPQAFHFLEVNARLQVEHPVTELVYGVDLVEAQLRIAAGEPLWLAQADLAPGGHAVEARICAEDVERGFLPRGGRIVAYREPAGAGIRVDSGVEAGGEVTAHYDSLLAKVIVYAPSRDAALDRLDRALASLVILGPPTTTAFLRRLLADRAVRAGALDTGLVERMTAPEDVAAHDEEAALVAVLARTLERAAGDDPWDRLDGWRLDGRAPQRWRMVPERGGEAVELVLDGDRARVAGGAERVAGAGPHPDGLAVTLDGRRRVWACARDGELTRVGIDGRAWAFREQPLAPRRAAPDRGAALEAPMPGSVLDVRVRAGDSVRAGDVLVVLESMKMELEVVAPEAGTVECLSVVAGDRVRGGQLLVAIGGSSR